MESPKKITDYKAFGGLNSGSELKKYPIFSILTGRDNVIPGRFSVLSGMMSFRVK